MIIGYDFWCDNVYYDLESTPIIQNDNDGVAFDNCNTLSNINNFSLYNGTYDEIHIVKDNFEIDTNTEKTEWTINTVLLAKFQNDLIAGTMGINGYDIAKIELRKRKKGDVFWQTFFTIDYNPNVSLYTIIDKFIESEEDYEYCLCPVAIDINGAKIYGNSTLPQNIYISYDHAHLFDNTASFDLIYNLKINTISNQIGANIVETLGSQYPYVIYGQNNYLQSNIECLLVSEESAVGSVDLKSEKILRNNILSFLNNKQHKVLKTADGLYMLIEITGTPSLIPSNEIMGVYQVSFDFVEVGNINNVDELSNLNFKFNYITQNHDGTSDTISALMGKNNS